MIELRRCVRLVINPPGAGGDAGAPDFSGSNGFGGTPPARGLARYYEFEVTCRGEADAATGYLINIKDVDRAVRATVGPRVFEACRDEPWTEPASMLPGLAESLASALPVRLARLRWRVTPTYSVEIEMDSDRETGDVVVLRQRFDFAAAHRLHDPAQSDEANRALFGKCNNPSGHGHNYQVEPAVEVSVRETGEGVGFTLANLERLTEAAVIEPFDHTHLNRDTEDFGPGGVNPSVEHMARVFFERLRSAMASDEGGRGARLRSVRVWETDRTSATYPG
ncbi:MAG: 6-carboxytetrahydropterin synthase [Phycisphaerales bacterium]|nr:MAG: 6-carboxytetrahydropterin synthase [Phycisphaerales bacterium]